ncbi:MAG: hypothetical protein AAFR66_19765 [Bacteroidota bacterium]
MRTLSKIIVYLLLIIAVEIMATYVITYKGSDNTEGETPPKSFHSIPDTLDHTLEMGIRLKYKAKADKMY